MDNPTMMEKGGGVRDARKPTHTCQLTADVIPNVARGDGRDLVLSLRVLGDGRRDLWSAAAGRGKWKSAESSQHGQRAAAAGRMGRLKREGERKRRGVGGGE